MFSQHASTVQLKSWGHKPGLDFAVRTWGTGSAHRKGDCWAIWMTDDPRCDEGTVNLLVRYVCVKSGDDDAEWTKQHLCGQSVALPQSCRSRRRDA